MTNQTRNDLDEYLYEAEQSDLGTVIGVLDGRGRYDDASALEVCDLSYTPDSESTYFPPPLRATILVDPYLLDTIDYDIVMAVSEVLQMVHRDFSVSVVVSPKSASPDWRKNRSDGRLAGLDGLNQGTYQSMPDDAPRKDQLRFHNLGELAIYDALIRKQAQLAPDETIGIMPGCAIRTVGRTFFPDFVVTFKGRVAGIEVDGPTHRGRAASDQSRDRLLQDAGLCMVERIFAEESSSRTEIDAFVDRFIKRLVR